MFLIISLFSLLLLFVLGAFFSAAETAMTALSQIDISALKEQSPKGAKIEALLKNPERLIASMLIGNNIANIGASALVAYLSSHYLGDIFVALSTFILSMFVIVFCEIAPKQIALIDKRKTALRVVLPALVFYRIFNPLLSCLLWITRYIFPVLRKAKSDENLAESLEHMIQIAGERGSISAYEHNFMHNVLELNDKSIRQIMTHRQELFCVDADELLLNAYAEIVEHSYSRIPVYRGDPENIVGVLYLSEVQKFYLAASQKLQGLNSKKLDFLEEFEKLSQKDFEDSRNFWEVRAGEFIKPVSFLPDSIKVSDLFFHFKQNEGNLVIVLNEYGSLAGLASQEDVLEAVFGKLYDEDERDAEQALSIYKDGEGFVFSGMLNIQQFEQFFHIEIEDNLHLATISGYLCNIQGQIPETGAEIEVPEGQFQVLESNGKRIVKLRFLPQEPMRQSLDQKDNCGNSAQ